jgi:hypothetical protein
MPTKAEEYRAKAAECAELALKAKDPQSKRVLQLTAEQWRALADSADKLHLCLISDALGGGRSHQCAFAACQDGTTRPALPSGGRATFSERPALLS